MQTAAIRKTGDEVGSLRGIMDLYAWIRLSPKGEVKLAGQRRRTQQSFNPGRTWMFAIIATVGAVCQNQFE